ncbi:MAG: hydrogenase maturation nickel metallochaperone HypA [Humidesulfovibrio sp.]|uniref:hydrogenase maturation nickel metallochaperone HypA/HybF n=1 Tax=Humidesulfovibrio sp. TaxID=2910988 RepID=UPI0027F44D81|nr:hydrogenase maturation nickel metallochaperone HypA [Humidesulfovibrio sp.]MDQ7835760.1 hydrogenase maturation nickel metallochaperone HypA [Humidesulfovibrio sp.]
MHELSLIQSMIDIIREERVKHGMERIMRVRVVNGALSGAVSDALSFGWECLTQEGELKGVALEIIDQPLRVACGSCGLEFEPEDKQYMPCPSCEEILGHDIISGKELYIEEIEADVLDDKGGAA